MNNEDKILAILTDMHSDIKSIDTRLQAVEGDLATVKSDVKSLTQKVDDGFRATRSELVDAVECVGKKVDDGFRATRSELVDAVECVGKKVEHLEQSFKDIESVTAQNAYDVQLIKRRA